MKKKVEVLIMKDFYLLRFYDNIFYFVGHQCLFDGRDMLLNEVHRNILPRYMHVSDIINGMAPIAITENMFFAAPM